jgi:hypothetical protein
MLPPATERYSAFFEDNRDYSFIGIRAKAISSWALLDEMEKGRMTKTQEALVSAFSTATSEITGVNIS